MFRKKLFPHCKVHTYEIAAGFWEVVFYLKRRVLLHRGSDRSEIFGMDVGELTEILPYDHHMQDAVVVK